MGANVTNVSEEDLESSPVKNNWETGFICTNFEVRNDDEKEYYGYGKLNIFPKNMESAKNSKIADPSNITDNNQLGFVIEFPQQDLTNIKQIGFLSYLGGERFLIPWRFFEKKPDYKNPWMNNKYIVASILNDKGSKYLLKITLPFKRMGWYISDKQGKDICEICKVMSLRQNLMVKNYKAEINSIFSRIEANYSSKQTIPNLKRLIDENKEKIKSNEEQVKELNDKINSIEDTISPMLIERENIKNKNEDLGDSINILSKKIEDIKNKDPNMQQKAMQEMRNSRNRLTEGFDLLTRMAIDRKDDINKAKDASLTFNESEMQKELNKVGALKLQVPA